MSSFHQRIAHVFPMRSEPQMVKIDAMAHIARVANLESFRDGTVRQLPDEPMDAVGFAFAEICVFAASRPAMGTSTKPLTPFWT